MNIYDCFMYFDEDLLLDIRLNILDKYVKKFIISEATYPITEKKKLNSTQTILRNLKIKLLILLLIIHLQIY